MAQAEASVIADSERGQAGVEHDVANAGSRTAVFVEVELKNQG